MSKPFYLMGQNYGNWMVLAKFENEQALNDFYYSEEYEPLKKLRIETRSNGGNFLSIPGFSYT